MRLTGTITALSVVARSIDRSDYGRIMHALKPGCFDTLQSGPRQPD